MVIKRFLNSKREKKLVLTQIILPLLMVLLGLLLIKDSEDSVRTNDPPRVLKLSNLSIEGVPNIGFYADFRANVTASTRKSLFDVSSIN